MAHIFCKELKVSYSAAGPGVRYFFREHYPWGRMPTWRREDGTLEYHTGWHAESDVDGSRCGCEAVITDMKMLQQWIIENWCPVLDYEITMYEQIKVGRWL